MLSKKNWGRMCKGGIFRYGREQPCQRVVYKKLEKILGVLFLLSFHFKNKKKNLDFFFFGGGGGGRVV